MGVRTVEKSQFWLPCCFILVFAGLADSPRSVMASPPSPLPSSHRARSAAGAAPAEDRLCGIATSATCIARVSRVYLFPDNWKRYQLTYAQAAKTVAHEIGHAVGLGHAHFCNFDSIMVQHCEPILQGLGPADIESLD